jgi:periplasmic protein TonB
MPLLRMVADHPHSAVAAATPVAMTSLTRESDMLSGGDRLGMMAFLSIILHTMVILGVGFAAIRPELTAPPLIEVTLSTNPADRAPDEYDFIAPDDQDGGGTLEEAQTPGRIATPLPDPRAQDALVQERPLPERRQDSEWQSPVLLAERALEQHALLEQHSLPDDTSRPDNVQQSERRELAAIDISDPRQQIDWSARYPSKTRIDARTRQHAAAAYMLDWIRQIEQIGNLNYPEAARERGLSGRLIVETTLLADGRIDAVRVLRRSEHALLDEAALRIVRMAAPFQPVPPEVLGGRDRLVITRTLEFVSGVGLQTGTVE